jgi:hypothetical protein
MNGDIFLTYLEQCLVPTLAPGEIVSMDNLPAHSRSTPDAYACGLQGSGLIG